MVQALLMLSEVNRLQWKEKAAIKLLQSAMAHISKVALEVRNNAGSNSATERALFGARLWMRCRKMVCRIYLDLGHTGLLHQMQGNAHLEASELKEAWMMLNIRGYGVAGPSSPRRHYDSSSLPRCPCEPLPPWQQGYRFPVPPLPPAPPPPPPLSPADPPSYCCSLRSRRPRGLHKQSPDGLQGSPPRPTRSSGSAPTPWRAPRSSWSMPASSTGAPSPPLPSPPALVAVMAVPALPW